MNTNAIKGNKMTKKDKFKKLDSATYRSWGQRVHVDIDTKKKTTTQEKQCRDTKIFNRYCNGEGCKKKQVKNIVDRRGDECKACYAEEFNAMRIGRAQFDISIPLEYSIAQKVAF
jgi:hypothetical protein